MKWADISVLVVAQSKRLGELIRETVRALGVTDIAIANSTAEALDLLRRYGHDCALVAFDETGFNFTLELRQSPASPNRYLPVVAIVGEAKIEHVRLTLNTGVHDLAVWPISADMLRQRLQRAVIAGKPFIQAGVYFGPCRRRRDDPARVGPERRANAAADAAKRAANDIRLEEFFRAQSAG